MAGGGSTHRRMEFGEKDDTRSVHLARGRHQGRFAERLAELDGHAMWAMILDTLRPTGYERDVASVRYLQASGSAAAMVLPRGIEMRTRAEVFTAVDAGALFEVYYRTGALPDGFVRRPAEGFAADGAVIDLSGVTP